MFFNTPRRRCAPAGRTGRKVSLRLDAFEDRTVPSATPPITVANNLDSGPGSLRQAIVDANAAPGTDTITFAHSVHKITLTTGELAITDSVKILGPGIKKLSISGNDASRVFNISAGVVTIDDLTITHGLADGSSPDLAGTGGGILNQAGATLNLDDVVLTKNQAIGDPTAVTVASPVFVLLGSALGGGIANFGVVSMSGVSLTSNTATGADAAVGGAFGVDPSFAGLADGGAMSNYGTANVSDSQFTGNVARGGNSGTGDFAAIGGGGAIFNDSVLNVTDSQFKQNLAIGGNKGVSPLHDGHALGGAINSGSLLPLVGGSEASLSVSHSSFIQNQAIGGNDNEVTLPDVAQSDGPDNAYGGGILVYEGSAIITHSTLHHNRAVGGIGGGDHNGSLGVGGGIFFYNFLYGVTASVTQTSIYKNEAVGGAGRDGVRGGNGLGAGIAMGSLGSAYAAPGALTLSHSQIYSNTAQGGAGGLNADGGNGLGGGIFNDLDSTTSMYHSSITRNQAKAGKKNGTGVDGKGIGGGLYNLGTFLDSVSVISSNHATTSENDRFG